MIFILKYIKLALFENIFLFTLILITSILQVCTSLIHTFAFNALLNGSIEGFLKAYAIGFVIWIVFLIGDYIENIYQMKVIQQMVIALRVDLTKRIASQDYDSFHKQSVGGYTSWFTNDISIIESSGFTNIYALLRMVFIGLVSLFALFQFHYSIMLATLFFAILMSVAPKFLSRHLNKSTLELSQENELFTNRIQNLFNGFSVLFFSNKTNLMQHFIEVSSEDLGTRKIRYAKSQGKAQLMISFLSVIAQISILVLNGILAFFKVVSLGTVTSTGSIAGNVFTSLSRIGGIVLQIRSVSVIFDKFDKVIPEIENIKQPIFGEFKELTIHNLNYRYGRKQVLKDFNMNIKKGQKYAITGSSGSGKSTLIRLLLGALKDYQGSIQFNDIELNESEDYDLHQYIGFIDQENYIFEGTILDNITLWEDYFDHQLESAINKSQLHEFIDELSYNAKLLSDGQKQRVSIARILLQNKPILIIDEGMSNLDEENAHLIEKQLLDNQDLTLIVVTHHLSDDMRPYYDQIIDLKHVM